MLLKIFSLKSGIQFMKMRISCLFVSFLPMESHGWQCCVRCRANRWFVQLKLHIRRRVPWYRFTSWGCSRRTGSGSGRITVAYRWLRDGTSRWYADFFFMMGSQLSKMANPRISFIWLTSIFPNWKLPHARRRSNLESQVLFHERRIVWQLFFGLVFFIKSKLFQIWQCRFMCHIDWSDVSKKWTLKSSRGQKWFKSVISKRVSYNSGVI